jgi:hypothetical protein
MGWACGTHGEQEKYVHPFVEKSEGNRQLRRLRRWEDRTKMALTETECDGVEWADLSLDRGNWQAVVNTVMNLLAPPEGRCCTVCVN